MQISRLFQIVYYLMERKNITASELAERLEVSARTIYRDIEVLAQAGIPVFAMKGKGGGIHLSEGFVLNKSLLTEEERKEILASLQGLSAIGFSDGPEKALQKLSSFFGGAEPAWLKVDLSDWGNRHQRDYELIKESIVHHKVITFDYYGTNGCLSSRRAEPIQLWFKNSAWYLKAYCQQRNAMRTFKISRMKRLQVSEETFAPKDAAEKQDFVSPVSVGYFTMWIDASQAYRVYDSFEEEEITRLEDGSFIVKAVYPVDDWFYGSILSYGAHGKILNPPELREKIREMLQKMLKNYQDSD